MGIKIAYRSDIDGLRAIAVLAVVLYHFRLGPFPGGFVGVDVFFVISGFLITAILVRGERAGKLDIVHFYVRRVRRIFPALIAIFLAVSVLGWFTLYSDQYRNLGKHILAGAAFVSNIVLWSEVGYFDQAAESKPLLHLWSLGVEEQFYFLWPFVVWIAYKCRANLLFIASAIGLASFALGLAIIQPYPEAAFYSPASRAWELMAGALLACSGQGNRNQLTVSEKITAHSSNWRATIGLILIVGSIVLIANSTPFPGWFALMPVVGASLIISAEDAFINEKILSHPLLVWFGMISYPLYLWHWPVLFFARTIFGESLPSPIRLAGGLLSVFLAWLTYRFIETPIRLRATGLKTFITLGAFAFAVFVGAAIFAMDGLPDRYKQVNDYAQRQWTLALPGATDCSSIFKGAKDGYCAKTSDSPYVAIIGDSHAGQLFYGFGTNSNKQLNAVVAFVAASCPPAIGVDTREDCNEINKISLATLSEMKTVKYLVVSAYYTYIDEAKSPWSDRLLEGYRDTFDAAKSMGMKVIFVVDNPALKISAEECVPSPFWLRSLQLYPSFCYGATATDLAPRPEYEKFIERMRLNFPSITFFDMESALCPSGNCPLFKDGKLLFGDTNHLSIYGSSLIADYLLRVISDR